MTQINPEPGEYHVLEVAGQCKHLRQIGQCQQDLAAAVTRFGIDHLGPEANTLSTYEVTASCEDRVYDVVISWVIKPHEGEVTDLASLN